MAGKLIWKREIGQKKIQNSKLKFKERKILKPKVEKRINKKKQIVIQGSSV